MRSALPCNKSGNVFRGGNIALRVTAKASAFLPEPRRTSEDARDRRGPPGYFPSTTAAPVPGRAQ
jgi:hypothetical protein